jgi:hypothetical protein
MPEEAFGSRDRRIELVATILLAAAALAAAWSTFQSGRWRGVQASNTGKSTAARVQSSQASGRAGQLTQIDIATFIQWVNATARGDEKLAAFYRRRFRPEFRPAFAAWLATRPLENAKAPATPFAMPRYRTAEGERAQQLEATADLRQAAAGRANRNADDYLLAVVLFASALFFAGISTKLHSPRQREVLLGLGGLIFLAALIWVATIPVNFSV